MYIDPGIPTIENYNKLTKSNLFAKMKDFSNHFLRKHHTILKNHSPEWKKDTLIQWSRQYEYPFVFQEIQKHIKNSNSQKIKILDAGSGVTFFPYYLNAIAPKANLHCCDYNQSFDQTFKKINKNSRANIKFHQADIRNLPFENSSFDIIYCVSVLEHTKNYQQIISEFQRILKSNGKLIITFDISINGSSNIPKNKAEKLLNSIIKNFKFRTELDSDKILTTKYIQKTNKTLLPWKHPLFSYIKRTFKNRRISKNLIPNLTCYCISTNKES